MSKKSFCTAFFFAFIIFFVQLAFAQKRLSPNDHTKVMFFALEHQAQIAKWMSSRRSKVKPSMHEIFNFLYKLSDNRSTYDVHIILGKTLKLTSKMKANRRFRSLNPHTRDLIKRVKNAKDITQLKQLLGRKTRARSGKHDPADIGLRIANKILQDGIDRNLYSENTLRRFAPVKKGMTRGFWHNAYNFVNDLAKDDAAGAITGAIVAGLSSGGVALPEGAIAGAIEGSVGSVAENIFSNIISNSTPAY